MLNPHAGPEHPQPNLTMVDPILRSMKTPTIICISDTHELHREVSVPDGDILIHAGDFTMFSKRESAIRDFNDWLGELPHRHKLVVPGNHEFFLHADPTKRNLISHATVLIDEAVDVMGLRIWGSPVTQQHSGAFGLSSPVERTRLYATIPSDVDVLVTHGPPYGIRDSTPSMPYNAGCRELLDAVTRLKPRLHVFGHIHGAHGTTSRGETLFVNAALLGVDGDVDAAPIGLRIPRA